MQNINKFLKGSGWFESKNPITQKAPIHQRVAEKKTYDKDFGNKNKISVKPKRNAILHFSISDVDMDKFTDLVLVQFKKDYGFIEITISRDEHNKTVVELPRQDALKFHDYILSKNSKFGSTDIETLIELQEDSFENNDSNSWNLK